MPMKWKRQLNMHPAFQLIFRDPQTVIDLIFFRTDSVLVGVIITDRVQTHKMRILRKLMPNKGVLKHVN